jgi:hypothetical protein
MKVITDSAIDWLSALDELSVNAFFLLNVLYRKDLDVSDKALMECTAAGLSTHRKYKRELISKKYLKVEQVERGEFRYTIGTGVSNG